ncbi:MAG: hypothetical protein KA028_01760 [Candidatus Pacebacteria bacterium]|nr:hypothetical protein [Candidatus Paceibacterota bacterium]MBP9852192.1 hypothetical protein [Candidatus Paceibacterota bacterium]
MPDTYNKNHVAIFEQILKNGVGFKEFYFRTNWEYGKILQFLDDKIANVEKNFNDEEKFIIRLSDGITKQGVFEFNTQGPSFECLYGNISNDSGDTLKNKLMFAIHKPYITTVIHGEKVSFGVAIQLSYALPPFLPHDNCGKALVMLQPLDDSSNDKWFASN